MTTWNRPAACSYGDCVEVAFDDDLIQVRDSKYPTGAVLIFDQTEWRAFIHGCRNGEFDVEDQ